MKYCVLYNPKANNSRGEEGAKQLAGLLDGEEVRYIDLTTIEDVASFLADARDERVVLCGGDGTLNRFVNAVAPEALPAELYYYPTGSGNDFWADLGAKTEDGPVDIARYLRDLPTVTVNGRTSRFLNGVGYGIDGYCCEVGDQLRETSDKPVNYAGIAIKGLLFHYKPTGAVVTVDGVRHEYKKVWLAPMMNGRYYGGGMIPTPDQDRLNAEHSLSVLVWHDSGKLPTLANFPSIFKGEHVKKSRMCEVFTGHEITVEFDRGVAAQIDGETVLDVTKCEARAYAPEKVGV